MSHNLLALVSNFRPVGRATFIAASFSLIQSRFICFPESICIFPLGCFVCTASQSEQRAHLSRTFLVSSAWCWTVVGFTPHCCTMIAIRQLLETVSSTLTRDPWTQGLYQDISILSQGQLYFHRKPKTPGSDQTPRVWVWRISFGPVESEYPDIRRTNRPTDRSTPKAPTSSSVTNFAVEKSRRERDIIFFCLDP